MEDSTGQKQAITTGTGGARNSGFSYGYVVIIASFVIVMMVYGAQFSFGVFFKPVVSEFGWSRSVTAGAYSLYMAFQGIWGFLAGRLSDRFGARPVVTCSGIFLGLGYLLMSRMDAVWQLYVFFGLLASGGPGCWVPLLSNAGRWFTRRMGLMTGIVAAGASVGATFMAPLANELIVRYGWRNSYVVVGVAGLVVVVIAAQLLRRPAGVRPGDGAARLGETNVVSEVRGLSMEEALHTRQFWTICFVFFAFGFCIHAVQVHIAPNAIDRGISAAAAATVVSVVNGLSAAGRIGLGGLGDRTGYKFVLVSMVALMLASLVWVQFAAQAWAFYVFAALFGLAYGGLVTGQSPLVAEFFGMRALGGIFGLASLVVTFGGAVGPYVAGYIFDVTNSYRAAFLIGAALMIAALLAALPLRPLPGYGRKKGALIG